MPIILICAVAVPLEKWLNKVIKEYGYDALTEAEKRYYQGEIPE